MGHEHHHHHSAKEMRGKKIVITIVLNVFITVAQVIGGIFANSIALLSDALHNFSDVVSLVISYVATKLTNKKNTYKHTFGYKRADIIAAFVNSATLIIIAIFLGKEAIERFKEPATVGADIVIYMALFSILMNALSVFILKGESKDNMNMKSAYLHLFSDVMTSVAVMIGGLLMKYFDLYWVDGVLTLIIAVYLLFVSWKLFTDSLKVLMQFVPVNINLERIISRIIALEGVSNLHHIHVWQINDDIVHFEGHIDTDADIQLSDFEEILQKINKILHEEGISHSIIQPEYKLNDNKDVIVQD